MAVIEGRAYWSFVTTPNTKFTPSYSVNLVVDESTADSFRDRGFTVKDMEEGPALIIKRKVDVKMGWFVKRLGFMTKANGRLM